MHFVASSYYASRIAIDQSASMNPAAALDVLKRHAGGQEQKTQEQKQSSRSQMPESSTTSDSFTSYRNDPMDLDSDADGYQGDFEKNFRSSGLGLGQQTEQRLGQNRSDGI
jgi:hypothetical protein